jgi:16S rRNA G966 N2-methylase RsmD
MKSGLQCAEQTSGAICQSPFVPSCDDNCNCARLKELLARYERRRRAIPVDFRKETSRRIDRARHYLHSYPAKLLAEIPNFFLSNTVLSRPGELILDPFCGSGTVLLEAARQGRKCVGADSNPLARLITRVKLSSVREPEVRSVIRRIRRVAPTITPRTFPDVVNMDYWYHPHVKKQLQQIGIVIERLPASAVKNYVRVCFSQCARDVSKADPRLSVPVVLRKDQYPPRHPLADRTKRRIARLRRINVLKKFCGIVEGNLRCVTEPIAGKSGVKPKLSSDAAQISARLDPGSVQLAITSPPYLGAQKYIRASSLSLGWLELCRADQLKTLEGKSIGREHFRKNTCAVLPAIGIPAADRRVAETARTNPVRAKIVNAYLTEMKGVIQELRTVIGSQGYLVLIVGNNHVCGKPFPTEHYLRRIAESEGFVTRLRLVDTIRSRGLMTKRNKTANVISREWVLVLQKV